MLRQAWSEVRRHPGRFVSTIIAVAISVAFLSGSAVLVATEGQAQGKSMNVILSVADVVIKATDREPVKGLRKTIENTPGVVAATPVLSEVQVVTTAKASELLQLTYLPPQELRWASLAEGRWPNAAAEVTLSRVAARTLGVALGDRLKTEANEPGLEVVGVTDEPSALLTVTGYAAAAQFAQRGASEDIATQWAVRAASGADVTGMVGALQAELSAIGPGFTVEPAAKVRDEAVSELTGDFDAFTNLLWAFAGVSLIVGMITIANTFSITLAQRRRQIGLLRAVGASTPQVRGRFLIEAILLGVVGSLLGLLVGIGLAAAETAWSTALFWGLSLPAGQLAIAFGLGVLATTAAAVVPILKGSRVAPLEALQPAAGAEERKRAWRLRAVVCGLLLLAGAGLAAVSVSNESPYALLIAIGAGALISLAVLFGGPLFVPQLLKASGVILRPFGAVPRLAADNAERNPRRATATATALMLAVGLMVTLQVATASVRSTAVSQIADRYPVDLQVAWFDDQGKLEPIPSSAAQELTRARGVDATVLLSAGTAKVEGEEVLLVGDDPGIAAATGQSGLVPDTEVWVHPDEVEELPKMTTVAGSAGQAKLKVVASRLVEYGEALVSSKVLPRIARPVPGSVMWLSVPDRSQIANSVAAVSRIAQSSERLSGSLVMAAMVEEVMGLLLAIATGLLAVAVLIALVGVSNTLGLSVLERTRESALLRALGLQARSLRLMLLMEAVQVALVGIVVGVVAGTFFGWLAVTSFGRSSGFDTVKFAVDLPTTLSMVAVAVVAAAVASLMPGRRAAKASPTEAMADI